MSIAVGLYRRECTESEMKRPFPSTSDASLAMPAHNHEFDMEEVRVLTP